MYEMPLLKPMNKYWKSPDELKFGPLKEKEPKLEMDHKNAVIDLFDSNVVEKNTSRRDFLKLMGFSLTAATLVAGCERPVQKTIPYLIKPEEITPGKASYYASTFFDGNEYASLLVKTRDGRPIKIEGNALSKFSRGKASARVQASVLSLYDEARYKEASAGGKSTSWEELDSQVMKKLNSIESKGGKVVLFSASIISPSTRKVIALFQDKYSCVEWIQYDSVSFSGMLTANQQSFGKQVIPSYHFDKARLIVSFGADFLGTWLNPVGFTSDYSVNRKLENGEKTMSRHIQFESGMSVTGSNADYRYPIKPSDERAVLTVLYKLLSGGEGSLVDHSAVDVRKLAKELQQHPGESLIVSGSNDVINQMLVNKINFILGNYGSSIDLDQPLNIRKGVDSEMAAFLDKLDRGEVDGLILFNANPLYDHPGKEKIRDAIQKMEFSLSFANAPDESAGLVEFIAPDHHYLESWNDAEPLDGSFSLTQPCIHPIFNTRQAQESLLKWMGEDSDYRIFVESYWKDHIFEKDGQSFKSFWTGCLQKGVFESRTKQNSQDIEWKGDDSIFSGAVSPHEGLELSLYQSVALGDGRDANNPWLQEMPDPVTKACWDNYLTISPAMAEEKGLENEDVVLLSGVEVPVFVQPGQAEGTVSLALGYGREKTGKVADGVGVDAYTFVEIDGRDRKYWKADMDIKKTNKKYDLALTQTHNSMEGRPIVRETTLEEYLENPSAGNEFHIETEKNKVTLYNEVKFDGHHWGMAINQNSCTSCGACIIACQAENNIPVVGKTEVRKRRILHWIRIDRYYSEDSDRPAVFHQPVMCQHCDNAPCENVCPVSATMHSNEGINQVAYNRCIGTKYCINNCPYRVRRFNWFKYANNDEFDYTQNSDLTKLVLNPDVVIRERGVVEKCSFCVQRIQEKKLDAKLENRQLEDGEIQPACVQTCPSEALVFGDLNDPESKVSKLFNNERNYHLLEELHTLPSVGYLTKVRNVENLKSQEEKQGEHM